MHQDPSVRVGLLLSDDCLLASRLLRDGQPRVAHVALDAARPQHHALATAMAQVLTALFPKGEGLNQALLDLCLVNLRPLLRLRRGELPQVALLASDGVQDALHASLRAASPSGQIAAGDTHSPAFVWGGDAPELFPACSLDALCPASHVVPVPLRQGADGQIVQALTASAQAQLLASLRALSVPAAALVLLHSPRAPQLEVDLAQALQQAGPRVVPSSALLGLQRGAGDERLRTRAAVLSAAVSAADWADRRGLHAGLPAGQAARWLSVRSDGTVGPAEQVPSWQQLIAPISAALLGGARQAAQQTGSGRFLCLVSDEGIVSGTAVQPALEPRFALAALCAVEQTGRPTVHSARCLDIPCDLPALSAALCDGRSAALSTTQRMAALYGYQVPVAADTAPAVAETRAQPGASALPLVLLSWADALSQATLRARALRERSVPLFIEASGAQQSGLVAAHLQRMHDVQSSPDSQQIPGLGQSGRLLAAGTESEWTADLRYRGQLGMLSLRGIGSGGPAGSAASDLVVRFVAEHQRVYGFSLPECPVELVQLRMRTSM